METFAKGQLSVLYEPNKEIFAMEQLSHGRFIYRYNAPRRAASI